MDATNRYGTGALVPLDAAPLEITCDYYGPHDDCPKCYNTGFVGGLTQLEIEPDAMVEDDNQLYVEGPGRFSRMPEFGYTHPAMRSRAWDVVTLRRAVVSTDLSALRKVELRQCIASTEIKAPEVHIRGGQAQAWLKCEHLYVTGANAVLDGAVDRHVSIHGSRVESVSNEGLVAGKGTRFNPPEFSAHDSDLVNLTLTGWTIRLYLTTRNCRWESVELIGCHVIGDVPEGVTLTRCTVEPAPAAWRRAGAA